MESIARSRAITFQQQTAAIAEETLGAQSGEGSPLGDTPVPSGAPRWVTPDLVAATIKTWQPYYADPLTAEDAVEILLSVAELVDALE